MMNAHILSSNVFVIISEDEFKPSDFAAHLKSMKLCHFCCQGEPKMDQTKRQHG